MRVSYFRSRTDVANLREALEAVGCAAFFKYDFFQGFVPFADVVVYIWKMAVLKDNA